MSKKSDSEEGMVRIPAGPFTMGFKSPGNDFHPPHEVDLSEFHIDRHPVTCERYAEFLSDQGYPPPPDWPGAACPPERKKTPVVNVTWADAAAFAEWDGGKRLPTEEEWEKAARGTEGFRFPWGDKWEARHTDIGSGEIGPVGRFGSGASPFGVEEMIGGVWEWTSTWYDVYPGGPSPSIHCGQKYRVIRGGSAIVMPGWPLVRTVYQRGRLFPQGRNDATGFRCVITTGGRGF